MTPSPLPFDYDADDKQWSARIVGIFFLLLGAVIVSGPWLGYLRESIRAIMAIFGLPMMVRGVPGVFWSLAEGGAFLLVGFGTLRGRRWAFFAGMVLALRLIWIGGLAWWVIGSLMLLWLARGLPAKPELPSYRRTE